MRVLWKCLDCGDNGLRVMGFPRTPEGRLDPRVWNRIRSIHDERNPGCGDRYGDALRLREESDEEMDARLRAG